MAQIKYLDSRRIMGESDGTDIAPTFEDDFSSDNWTDSDSAKMGVQSGYLYAYGQRDGTNDSSSRSLGTTLNGDFVFRTKVDITSWSAGSVGYGKGVIIGLSDQDNTANDATSQDSISISISARQTNGDGFYAYWSNNQNMSAGGSTRIGSLAISTGILYFEIIKNGTTVTYNIYSDNLYSTLVATATHTSVTATGFTYAVVRNENGTASSQSGYVEADIDDWEVFAGVTSVTAGKPKSALSLSGCKAYYNFEQTSGSLTNIATTANGFSDGLGSSLDATVSGSPTRNATGKLGSYATTNVNGAYFTLPNTSGNNNLAFLCDGEFTISFWIKKASSGVGVIIGSASGSGGWSGFTMSIDPSTGNLSFFRRANTDNTYFGEQVNYNSAITDTNWHHVVVTGTTANAGAKLYIDGSQKTFTFNYADPKSGSSYHQSNLTLFGYGSSFVGTYSESAHTLDEFSIWNRALTLSEVSALYNSGTGVAVNDSSLQVKPETNSIFIETDTATRYWFNGSEWILQPTYQTNFSSSSAWTQTGTYVTIDTANNSLTWDGIRTTSSHGLHHDLGANIVSSKWLLEFDFVLDSYSGGTYTHMVGVMLTDVDSTGGTYGSDATRKFVGMRLNWRNETGSQQRKFYIVDDEGGTEGWSDNSPYNTPDDSTAQNFPSASTTYHMKLIKDGSSHSLEIWNESETSLLDTLNGSNSTTADIRYILVQTYNAASAESSTFNGKIKNMKFYNGVTSV